MKTGGDLSSAKAKEMLRDGTANGKKLTGKQKRYFGWVAGGRKAENGTTILDDDTVQFNGPSHSDGGIPINYKGTNVEVEGGETAYKADDGSLVVMGNMKNPITGRKFKTDSKILAKNEMKNNALMDYSTELVNKSNPFDKWESLKFNSGMAMMIGSRKKQQSLAQSKAHLADMQQAMLDISNDHGIDPQAFSNGIMKKAKNGMKIIGQPQYQDGGSLHNNKYLWAHRNDIVPPTDGKKLSLAQRHNNPGNLKYADWMKKYGAVKGEAGKDGGYFAKFPSVEQGQAAMVNLISSPSYKKRTVGDAIDRWTNHQPYANIDAQIKGKKIGDLQPQEFNLLLNTITKGEDSKTYNWDNVTSNPPAAPPQTQQPPFTTDRVGGNPQFPDNPDNPYNPRRIDTWQPYDFQIKEPKDYNVPSNAENLKFTQILPELFAAATNRTEPVFAQKLQPELFEPYRISLQDQRNRNNSTFRAASQSIQDNPEAIAALAAQKYEADSSVSGEEFRINQQIANDITNKNVALLNDANEKNLQLADTQFVRQTQARANTKATNQAILNSISSKVLQNSLENRTLQVYENLYPHFRYDQNENYNLEKVGAPGQEYLNTTGFADTPQSSSFDTRVRSNYDANGKLKSYTRIKNSDLQTATEQVKLNNLKDDSIYKQFQRRKVTGFPKLLNY